MKPTNGWRNSPQMSNYADVRYAAIVIVEGGGWTVATIYNNGREQYGKRLAQRKFASFWYRGLRTGEPSPDSNYLSVISFDIAVYVAKRWADSEIAKLCKK